MWNPLQIFLPKKFLGIDIGTSYIKMVEISKFGHRRKLENYASLSASVLFKKPFRTFEKNTILFSSSDISRAIKAVMEEARIKTRQVVFSIPDFSTFFTNFELPLMTKEELPQAVRYEARQHIPLPLGEVSLDWQTIEDGLADEKKIKILLAAVPNEIINQYREIAKLSQLELSDLEAEVFGLIRSLVREDEMFPVVIVDIGAQSTTCNIVEKRILKRSYSFDVSGNELTQVISKALNVDYREAEEIKEKSGLLLNQSPNVREILLPLIDAILVEVERIFNNFQQKDGKEVQKIILAGGSAFLPGLKEYFAEHLKKEVGIADPFSASDIFYPPILEKTLKTIGPSFAIAVGMALRGLES